MSEIMHTVESLIATPWLYLIILVWVFFEGETIVIIAGMAAKLNQDHPYLALIILAAFVGGIAGDQTWFFVGRYHGKRLLARRPSWEVRAQKVYRILERHSTWLILGFRFLYGLRNVTPFALGMSDVRTVRFIVLNIIGAAIWATSFGLGGYLAGQAVEDFLGKHKITALVVLVGLVAAIWVIKLLIRRYKASKLLKSQQTAASSQQNR